jgi:nitrate reductase NapD
MNISGMVVKTAPEHLDQVMESLNASGLCEIHFHDETGKIIVTVEGTDTGEEVKKMRDIMNFPHVLCVDLAYSYNEDGLEGNLEQLERVRDAVPEALRCPPADA